MGKKEKPIRKKYEQKSHFYDWSSRFSLRNLGFFAVIYKVFPNFNFQKISFLIVFAFLFSLLLFLDFDRSPYLIEGQVTKKNIVSPFNFSIVDPEATQQKKDLAVKKVLPIYDYNPHIQDQIEVKIKEAFQFMNQKGFSAHSLNEKLNSQKIQASLSYLDKVNEILGVKLTEREFLWLTENNWSFLWKRNLLNLLNAMYSFKIVVNDLGEDQSNTDAVLLRELNKKGEVLEEFKWLRSKLKYLNKKSSFLDLAYDFHNKISQSDKTILYKISYKFLKPTVFYNLSETNLRKKQAIDNETEIKLSINKGDIIVVAGSTVSSMQQRILGKIQDIEIERRTGGVAYAATLLFIVLILVFLSFIKRTASYKIKVRLLDMQVMGFIALLTLLSVKLFLLIAQTTLISHLGFDISPEVISFLTPVALGSILVGLLMVNGEFVWIFTVFLAIAMGVIYQGYWPLITMTIIGGIAGARGVYNCKKRTDIYKAGLRAGMVQSLVVFLSIIVYHMNEKSGLSNDLLWGVPIAFVGGLLSSFFAMIFIPIIETLFNYTTNIKLLELSDFNHPILRDLAIRAPGTYHHCLAVGSMAEEAATEIGANSLLARVMSYYHDIGKMEHAQYFIENQKDGRNPHNAISPYLSKTIIVAHVKDGAEMGLRYKLGKPIIDGILQHHGTSLISYFYKQAQDCNDSKQDYAIQETEFRYPGPKPQFKEAAIVMLADSIEATARSKSEPTPTRLSNLVRDVIQDKFLDGQLDECDLTLKDLSIIEKAFYRVLIGIYHQRSDYPHLKFGENTVQSLSQIKKG